MRHSDAMRRHAARDVMRSARAMLPIRAARVYGMARCLFYASVIDMSASACALPYAYDRDAQRYALRDDCRCLRAYLHAAMLFDASLRKRRFHDTRVFMAVKEGERRYDATLMLLRDIKELCREYQMVMATDIATTHYQIGRRRFYTGHDDGQDATRQRWRGVNTRARAPYDDASQLIDARIPSSRISHHHHCINIIVIIITSTSPSLIITTSRDVEINREWQ